MSPRWPTIENLVVERGGGCPSPGEPGPPDETVRAAWMAIAVAQDRIARLSEVTARARALRDRAQALQDDSLRLRRRRPSDKP